MLQFILFAIFAVFPISSFANTEKSNNKTTITFDLRNNTSQTLNDILKKHNATYKDSVDTDKCLEIYLGNQSYILNERLEFRCNVIIRGCKGAKVIAQDINKFTDDCLLSAKGTETNKIKFEVYDTEFHINESEISQKERHYFKIYDADYVVFYNCKFFLKNGTMTNIDLRRCSNIEIQDCLLENYNDCKAGGILWIRGETKNVVVSKNIFRKHGNDEALAIWGNAGSNAEKIIKEDIFITENQFEYVKKNARSENYRIDNLIALYDTAQDSIHYIWENIHISNNTFIIRDLARFLIDLRFLTPNTTISEFYITNNTIRHDTYKIEEGEFVIDFGVRSYLKSNRVFISNNQCIANQTIANKSQGYIGLLINSSTVEYKNNNIDASNIKKISPNIETGFIGIKTFEGGGNIVLENNSFKGLFRLAEFTSSSSVKPINLELISNRFEGNNQIYCRNLSRLYAIVNSNVFKADNYYLLFQEFGKTGSFQIYNNTWIKSSKNKYQSGNLCYLHNSSDYSFEKIIFGNNTFIGYTKNQISPLPNASTKIESGNIFQ